jgi:hypothetical protein
VDQALTCLYAFTSNEAPAINTQRSNMRRAIFVRFKPSDEVELITNLPGKLWAERAGIVGKCLKRFEGLWEAEYERLRVDEEANRSLAEDNESGLEDVLHQHFDLTGECDALKVVEVLERDKRWGGKQIGEFYSFLERRFKIKKKRVTRGGRKATVMFGMSLRGDTSTGDQSLKF